MPTSDRPTPAVPPAAESWVRLVSGLIGGIYHALNNRMAALSAVGQVLDGEVPGNHPLAGAMTCELERLEATVGLLRLLATAPGPAEPLQVEPLIAEVEQLFGMHHSLRDLRLEIDAPASVPPVVADPTRLLRGILILIAAAGRDAGADVPVRLELRGDTTSVTVTVRAKGADPAGGSAEGLEGIEAMAAGDLVAEAGGDVRAERTDAGVSYTLTLPTLAEARRREAERSS